MPLVRYELRSEHSLANPELFRSAARDDPEGLLEGVAMAGLVGIVRQLGDLAEFAAEVFRDLHEEFVSVGGRAHDLTVRVRTLEAELPAVEKSLLSEPNQLRFAYTNGADWHASIRSDQNHCTSGDLPRFVRKYYQECRGPPRLFLLDKYDVVGAGACLKRYSDPSFFKLEWASSELMKAQRAQRDKKARREKKKGRRRKTGLPTPAIHQIPARVRYGSATLEDLDTLSQLLAPTLKNEVDLSSSNQSGRDERGTQTQRKSNLGPQNKESGYPPQPTAVSPAPEAESGASESLKLNAKEIEANSPRIYRKVAEVTDMEDHVATPAVGPVSRDMDKMPRHAAELPLSGSNVVADRTKQVAAEDFEAAAVARAFGRKPEGDALHAGGEVPKLGNGSVSQSRLRNVFSKTSNEDQPKEYVIPSESRTSSRTVAGDAGPQEDLSSTNTGGVRGPGQLFGKAVRKNSVDAKEAHVIAARFPRQGSGKLSRGTSDLGNAVGRDSAEHHLGNGSQRQSIAKHRSPTDGGQGVDRQPEHYTSKASGHVPTPVGKSERSLSSSSAGGEPGFQDGREHITSSAVGTSEALGNMQERTNSPPRLPPIRIEEIRVQREEPPLILSQCSSPGPDDIRPSVSMLSRMSYSSELLGISSESEPDSPVSPNSPPFNALYSPPGSPSRFSGGMAESPPGTYMGSYSPVAEPFGYRNSRSEIPVLSLSPRSGLESPSWADQGDSSSAPVRPPPPRPAVISMAESRGQDESRQEPRSVDSQPSHSTSPSISPPTGSRADGDPSSLNEERGHVVSSQDTAEVHAEPAGKNGDYLERVAHLEAPREHSEGMRSPDANSEAEGSFRSAASSPGMRGPSRLSMPSSFDNLDSDTTQPSSTGLVDLGPAESHSVDVPLEETTLRIGDSPPIPVGEDGAFSPFEPRVGSAADASSNAVPVHHAPSSSGQGMNGGVYSMFAEGEESEPSSPSGSVIIKDTPSRGSRSSDDSENEAEAHDYYASHGPVSPRSVAHALEDVINRRSTGSGDLSVHEDLIDEASESAPTNAASTQEGGVVNSIAEHVVQAACIAPEERVEAFVSQTSTELDIPQETNSSQDPTSALDRIDAISLRAISVSTADVESHKRSASNSPPGTPPGKAFIEGEDEASTLQLEGTSRPESPYESGSRVAPASSSSTSATNSPPTSPPKVLEHASSLRWRGRAAEQDFSLPPNLVCHTETSSPPYSPPPASDLESPRPWDEVSEVSMSSDRSRKEDGDVEVYPLPYSPASPESPMRSEEGDSVLRRASDEDDDGAALEEVEVAESGSGRADHQLPLKKSSEALSSGPQVSDDVLPASEVPSTFQYSRPDVEVEHSQELTLENEGNLDEKYSAHETPPPVSAPEFTDTPQKALGVASTQQDWNVDLNERQSPLESEPSEAVEEVEGKETMVRPASMINVAAILEKANAIRQAFVGSDDESDEDEWNDS